MNRWRTLRSTWSEFTPGYSRLPLVFERGLFTKLRREDVDRRPDHQRILSIASCWEIAIKTGVGKLNLGEPATTFLPRELARNRFDLLGVELRHATFVETLPHHHRDPFDRMLVSQSLIEAIPIISGDAALDPYGVQRLW